MGAGPRFPYPKEVWSPAGGWWAFPKAWRANTAIAFMITALACVPVFIISEQKMVRTILYSTNPSLPRGLSSLTQLSRFPRILRKVRVGSPNVPIPWRPSLKVAQDDDE